MNTLKLLSSTDIDTLKAGNAVMIDEYGEWVTATALHVPGKTKTIGIELLDSDSNVVSIATEGSIYSPDYNFTPNEFVCVRDGVNNISQDVLLDSEVNAIEDTILIIGIATSENTFKLFDKPIEHTWGVLS
jgi:hypothetical protein